MCHFIFVGWQTQSESVTLPQPLWGGSFGHTVRIGSLEGEWKGTGRSVPLKWKIDLSDRMVATAAFHLGAWPYN